MFDISWGETFIVIGISVTLIGRRDLPKASHFLGHQVGRVVGLLQGARARADRFAVDNELSALQSELRSGLRELDTVKGELAVAASSRGIVGRGLMMAPGTAGSTGQRIVPQSKTQSSSSSSSTMGTVTDPSVLSGSDYLTAARNYEASSSSSSSSPSSYAGMVSQLAPRAQSVAAVAEEEWEKQGIGFRSRAEMGTGSVGLDMGGSGGSIGGRDVGGSTLLANLIQQNLIHDQYDRAVMEQDRELNEKMDRRRKEKENNDVMEEKKV